MDIHQPEVLAEMQAVFARCEEALAHNRVVAAHVSLIGEVRA